MALQVLSEARADKAEAAVLLLAQASVDGERALVVRGELGGVRGDPVQDDVQGSVAVVHVGLLVDAAQDVGGHELRAGPGEVGAVVLVFEDDLGGDVVGNGHYRRAVHVGRHAAEVRDLVPQVVAHLLVELLHVELLDRLDEGPACGAVLVAHGVVHGPCSLLVVVERGALYLKGSGHHARLG